MTHLSVQLQGDGIPTHGGVPYHAMGHLNCQMLGASGPAPGGVPRHAMRHLSDQLVGASGCVPGGVPHHATGHLNVQLIGTNGPIPGGTKRAKGHLAGTTSPGCADAHPSDLCDLEATLAAAKILRWKRQCMMLRCCQQQGQIPWHC